MSLASAIYTGRIAHARQQPRRHGFAYRIYMLYLDLDELPSLRFGRLFAQERAALLSYYRSDYGTDSTQELKHEVLDAVQGALGRRPAGPVRVLTHVRSLGYVFNPVSFYYCYAEDGETLEAVVAEITNTPWHERHRYVIAAKDGLASDEFAKSFHVSPFFPMQQRYRWHLTKPAELLRLTMDNLAEGEVVFKARLTLKRRALNGANLWRVALTQPLMSARLLPPGGKLALQAITIADQHFERARDEADFIKRYIFPGSCIPSLTALVSASTGGSDLRLRGLDDYSAHYARTLATWRERLLPHQGWVIATYGKRFWRMWLLYLAYCEGGFTEGHIGLAQLVFERDRWSV